MLTHCLPGFFRVAAVQGTDDFAVLFEGRFGLSGARHHEVAAAVDLGF